MRITRENIREAIEAPKQALVLALAALGIAALALLLALGALAHTRAAS